MTIELNSALGLMPHGDPPSRAAALPGQGARNTELSARAAAALEPRAKAVGQHQGSAPPVAAAMAKTKLSIGFDRDVGVFISRSLDARTGEVIDQYPAEARLRQMKAFAEQQRQAAAEQPILDETA